MTNLKEKLIPGIIIGLVAGLIVLGGLVIIPKIVSPKTPVFGAVSGMLIENYDPYVRLNGGINTGLPIQTSGGIVNSSTLAQSGAATFTSTVAIGSTGTAINQVNVGQCYIKAYAATIAASSTASVDCQGTALAYSGVSVLTGVQRGDNVQMTLSTTTAGTTFMGLGIIGAAASTTNGYISLTLANFTGGTFTWPTTGAATGTASYLTSR